MAGGPILDCDGEVIGIDEWIQGKRLYAIDLAGISGGDPAQFCFGVAAGKLSTVCAGRRRAPGSLSRDIPPRVCSGGRALAPPVFTSCPTTAPRSKPFSFVGCWVSSQPTADRSDRLTRVGDERPTVYFDEVFDWSAPAGTTEEVVLTSPGGTSTFSSSSLTTSTASIPISWPSSRPHIAHGTWAFETRLSTGSSSP